MYLTNFYKKYLQNLKYNVKRLCIFHLILVGILYCPLRAGRVGGGFLLNGQNLLRVTKVICWHSPTIVSSRVGTLPPFSEEPALSEANLKSYPLFLRTIQIGAGKTMLNNIRRGGCLMMMLNYKGGGRVKKQGKSDYIISDCS